MGQAPKTHLKPNETDMVAFLITSILTSSSVKVEFQINLNHI